MNLRLQKRKLRFTLWGLPQRAGGDWGQGLPRPPVPALLGVPGPWWSPPGKELWKDSLLKSLVACQSILGLVATGLAGSWWGLGVVRIGGPDPVNPGLGALGGSLV